MTWVLVSRFHGVGFHVWVLVSRFWFGHGQWPRTALPKTALPRTALPLQLFPVKTAVAAPNACIVLIARLPWSAALAPPHVA